MLSADADLTQGTKPLPWRFWGAPADPAATHQSDRYGEEEMAFRTYKCNGGNKGGKSKSCSKSKSYTCHKSYSKSSSKHCW